MHEITEHIIWDEEEDVIEFITYIEDDMSSNPDRSERLYRWFDIYRYGQEMGFTDEKTTYLYFKSKNVNSIEDYLRKKMIFRKLN